MRAAGAASREVRAVLVRGQIQGGLRNLSHLLRPIAAVLLSIVSVESVSAGGQNYEPSNERPRALSQYFLFALLLAIYDTIARMIMRAKPAPLQSVGDAATSSTVACSSDELADCDMSAEWAAERRGSYTMANSPRGFEAEAGYSSASHAQQRPFDRHQADPSFARWPFHGPDGQPR